jgi:hypothetical protein
MSIQQKYNTRAAALYRDKVVWSTVLFNFSFSEWLVMTMNSECMSTRHFVFELELYINSAVH